MMIEFAVSAFVQLYQGISEIVDAKASRDRFLKGEDLIKGPKKFENALKRLNEKVSELKRFPQDGWLPPREHKVSVQEVRAGRTSALLRKNLELREAYQRKVREEILPKLEEMRLAAKKRQKTARDLWRSLENALKKASFSGLPGTALPTEMLSMSELALKAAGALGRVAQAAEDAHRGISRKLAEYSRETEILRRNLETFPGS